MKWVATALMAWLFPVMVFAQANPCYCVSVAREYATSSVPTIDAKDFILLPSGVGIHAPTAGGLVLLRYGSVYHLAAITSLQQDGVWIHEGNFIRCKETDRFITWDDAHLIRFLFFE